MKYKESSRFPSRKLRGGMLCFSLLLATLSVPRAEVLYDQDIRFLAMEISDWNMTLWNTSTKAPGEKLVDLPSGLDQANILSMSAIIRGDDGKLYPLESSGPGHEIGWGGNLSIVRGGLTGYTVRLQGRGAPGQGVPVPTVRTGLFSSTNFDATGTHRGWILLEYKGPKVTLPANSYDNVNMLMLPLGRLNFNYTDVQTQTFPFNLPTDIADNDIVRMEATIIRDDGEVQRLNRHHPKSGTSLWCQGSQAHLEHTREKSLFKFQGEGYSSTDVNRGWMVVYYKGTPSQQAANSYNFTNIERAASSLDAWDIYGIENEVRQVSLPSVFMWNSPLKVGAMSSIIRNDAEPSWTTFRMENFTLSCGCRLGEYSLDPLGVCGGSGGSFSTAKGGNMVIGGDNVYLQTWKATWEGNQFGDLSDGGFSIWPKFQRTDFNRGWIMTTYQRPQSCYRNAATGMTYTFTIPVDARKIRVTLEGGSGDADMYVKMGGTVSMSNWDCRPYLTGNYEECTYENASGGSNNGTLNVLLNNYSGNASGLTLSVDYKRDGSLRREVWNGISGTSVSSLTSNANYPNSPSSTTFLNTSEAPANTGDNYGTRLRGYLIPGHTGNHVLAISGDDDCQLWLSTNEDPANKQLVASLTGSSAPREWFKYPSQTTYGIPLSGGQAYYIEVLHKEGSGGDHVEIGWMEPGGGGIKIIPSRYLAPVAYYRIKNRWKGNYMYQDGSILRYGGAPAAWDTRFQWETRFTTGYQYLINRGTGQKINNQNLLSNAEASSIPNYYTSGHWTMNTVETVGGIPWRQFQNRWQSGRSLHEENQLNYVQCSALPANFTSGHWSLESVP